jgi:hypothetical protein
MSCLPASAQTAAQEDTPSVPGPNKRFCSDWNISVSNASARPEVYLENINWMYGFIAGMTTTYWSTHNHMDLLNGMDAETIGLWTNKYCAKNPDSSMWVAGILFFHEIGGNLP